MKDYMIRGTAANDQIRFFAAYTKDTVETARSSHNTSRVATAALGRLLTAGLMMGAMGKNEDDLVTLKIDCQGPIQGLLVTADIHGNVKGYAKNPNVHLPARQSDGKIDVAGALDLGVMSIIREIGLKEPYIGQTHLVSGEIAEDLTYYFATSEQIPSSVALGVLVNDDNTVRQAGGFIIQLMPFADDETIDALEAKLGQFTSVTTELDKGKTLEEMLEDLLGPLTIHDEMPVQFKCNCSRERVEGIVISVGEAELLDMIKDGEPIEVNCQFCNTNYVYTIDDLKQMLEKAK
ncbi:MAG: Hsp33 family molecular chaperone HslO [Lachnospiraceae bacterium]|nr:Hsp33 family molecular chaperone HslO [Lachnospiraceae bacterium]